MSRNSTFCQKHKLISVFSGFKEISQGLGNIKEEGEEREQELEGRGAAVTPPWGVTAIISGQLCSRAGGQGRCCDAPFECDSSNLRAAVLKPEQDQGISWQCRRQHSSY